MKGIFTTRVISDYDDLPERQYHFPRTYLRQVERCVGDWIVYYEPRRSSGDQPGGRQVYFATAQVTGVRPDPAKPDHFYADVQGYFEFPRAVPFREGQNYYESKLRRDDGGTSKGAFGRSVRDPSFQRLICQAFELRCHVCGLHLFNGGGGPAVQIIPIKFHTKSDDNRTENRLILRLDPHRLVDTGFVTVTQERRIEFSGRIKEEFENGQVYYRFHGKRLMVEPGDPAERPSADYLASPKPGGFQGVRKKIQ